MAAEARFRTQPPEGMAPVLLGPSRMARRLGQALSRIARSELPFLIVGESGLGKAAVARFVHAHSRRATQPFVAVDLGALPPERMEAELFGEGGALAQAAGGTLFLREIGRLPLRAQARLAEYLERRHNANGGARIAASASEDLAQCIAAGRFSEPLYERLSALSVALPPLRERREDVPTLAEYWLARACSALGFAPPPVEPSAMKVLAAYDWPGNLRELRQVMHRLAVLAPGPAITVGDVALALAHAGLSEGRETLADAVRRAARRYLAQLGAADAAELYRQVLAQVEPALLAAVLEHTRGHQLRAARLLGINRNTLRSMLRRYGLNPEDFK